nr:MULTISPECIES: ATP-binding protein [unclassified Clostridium]
MNSPFWSLVMRNFLEFFSMVPCAVLCFLPVQDRLRRKPLNLFLTGIPLSILWAFAGGLVCADFGIARDFWVLPSFILFAVFFHRVCDLALWKPFSILTAVCAVFSCITNLTLVADALIDRTNTSGLFTLPGAGIHLLLSVLIVAIVWYPATHAAKWLVDDIEMAKTWYIFWVFPAAFFLLNRLIRPRYYETLYTNRVMKFYPILILALLTFLLLFYFMFYLMASEMNQNTRLLRENELLQLQSAQYRNLQRSIDETRIARHDLRQHLTVLSGYAANKDLDAISDYLASFRKHMMPEWLPAYCENQAVNAILGYYAQIAENAGTALEIQAQMEKEIPVPEPEFCVLLGNLLENAVDACRENNESGAIKVHIRQTGTSLIAITVDNPCRKPPALEGKRFLSTKHSGPGIGTQSIRLIAERHHGDARFEWKNGMFYASVILIPSAES